MFLLTSQSAKLQGCVHAALSAFAQGYGGQVRLHCVLAGPLDRPQRGRRIQPGPTARVYSRNLLLRTLKECKNFSQCVNL